MPLDVEHAVADVLFMYIPLVTCPDDVHVEIVFDLQAITKWIGQLEHRLSRVALTASRNTLVPSTRKSEMTEALSALRGAHANLASVTTRTTARVENYVGL